VDTRDALLLPPPLLPPPSENGGSCGGGGADAPELACRRRQLEPQWARAWVLFPHHTRALRVPTSKRHDESMTRLMTAPSWRTFVWRWE
jgi:hypothetical protein